MALRSLQRKRSTSHPNNLQDRKPVAKFYRQGGTGLVAYVQGSLFSLNLKTFFNRPYII